MGRKVRAVRRSEQCHDAQRSLDYCASLDIESRINKSILGKERYFCIGGLGGATSLFSTLFSQFEASIRKNHEVIIVSGPYFFVVRHPIIQVEQAWFWYLSDTSSTWRLKGIVLWSRGRGCGTRRWENCSESSWYRFPCRTTITEGPDNVWGHVSKGEGGGIQTSSYHDQM